MTKKHYIFTLIIFCLLCFAFIRVSPSVKAEEQTVRIPAIYWGALEATLQKSEKPVAGWSTLQDEMDMMKEYGEDNYTPQSGYITVPFDAWSDFNNTLDASLDGTAKNNTLTNISDDQKRTLSTFLNEQEELQGHLNPNADALSNWSRVPNTSTSKGFHNPLTNDTTGMSIAGLIGRVLRGFLGIAGSLAVVFIILGGINIVFAAGSEDKITKGKKTLVMAILGLIIAFAGFMVVGVIIDRLGT